MDAPQPQQLAVRTQQFDLSPQNFEQALTFSEYLAASDLVPKNFQGKPGNCLIAMQWGAEVGMKTLQALQSIAVINNKPNIFGDAGKALLLSHGCIIDEDDTRVIKAQGYARCKIIRPGRPPVERTFSLEDAQAAKLLNKQGPWVEYRERQMAWRAFWFAARDAAADILRGMGGAEEAMDMTKDMGPAQVVGATPAPPAAPPEPPAYSQAELDANVPAWRKAFADGKATPDALISRIGTKAVLSEAQKTQIRNLVPIENGTPATTPTTPTTPAAANQADPDTGELPWKD